MRGISLAVVAAAIISLVLLLASSQGGLNAPMQCITYSVDIPRDCSDSRPLYIVWHWPEREFSVGVDCSTYLSARSNSNSNGVGIMMVWIDNNLVGNVTLVAASNTYWFPAQPGSHIVRLCYTTWS